MSLSSHPIASVPATTSSGVQRLPKKACRFFQPQSHTIWTPFCNQRILRDGHRWLDYPASKLQWLPPALTNRESFLKSTRPPTMEFLLVPPMLRTLQQHRRICGQTHQAYDSCWGNWALARVLATQQTGYLSLLISSKKPSPPPNLVKLSLTHHSTTQFFLSTGVPTAFGIDLTFQLCLPVTTTYLHVYLKR